MTTPLHSTFAGHTYSGRRHGLVPSGFQSTSGGNHGLGWETVKNTKVFILLLSAWFKPAFFLKTVF